MPQRKFDYIAVLSAARAQQKLSLRKLSVKSGIGMYCLGRVFNRKAHLTREQAFYVGKALKLTPVERELLALWVVYTNAKRAEFKKHISNKINKIKTLQKGSTWLQYIQSTLN